MKRFGIWLIVAMFGLVLACGSGEEKKAPAKSAAPPAKVEKVAPQAPPAAPAPPAPEQPKPSTPSRSIRSNIRALDWGLRVQTKEFLCVGAR